MTLEITWTLAKHSHPMFSPDHITTFLSIQSLTHIRLFAPHGLQHARPPCPSPTPGVYLLMSIESVMPSNHLLPVVPFSSHLQSFPASGSFPVSQFFVSGGQSIRVSASASVLPMNIQDWFPLEWIYSHITYFHFGSHTFVATLGTPWHAPSFPFSDSGAPLGFPFFSY